MKLKLSFHITFADGSNPYYGFLTEAKEATKAVNKWVKSTHRGTWMVYKDGKYCDTALKEYTWLANAVKFLEKEIQKTLDK